MMRVVGILPIKKHSERVPGKNFRALAGVPLWMYALAAMAESRVIDKIVIDTDAPEMFPVTETLVPIVIEEREELVRGDDVSMNKVLATVIARHEADAYVQLHASNPFITPESIRHALDILERHAWSSVFSVTEIHSRFWEYGHTGYQAQNHDPSKLIPTQDLPAMYEENSSLYAFRRDAFLSHGSRICGSSTVLRVSPIEAIDIDVEGDWLLAERVAEGKRAMAAKST